MTSLQYMCRYKTCALRRESEIDSRNMWHYFDEQDSLRRKLMRTKFMTTIMRFQRLSLHYKLLIHWGQLSPELLVDYSFDV
jgi:hypothetical protein